MFVICLTGDWILGPVLNQTAPVMIASLTRTEILIIITFGFVIGATVATKPKAANRRHDVRLIIFSFYSVFWWMDDDGLGGARVVLMKWMNEK